MTKRYKERSYYFDSGKAIFVICTGLMLLGMCYYSYQNDFERNDPDCINTVSCIAKYTPDVVPMKVQTIFFAILGFVLIGISLKLFYDRYIKAMPMLFVSEEEIKIKHFYSKSLTIKRNEIDYIFFKKYEKNTIIKIFDRCGKKLQVSTAILNEDSSFIEDYIESHYSDKIRN